MKKLLTIIAVVGFIFSCKQEIKTTKISGLVFGTSYAVVYDSHENFEAQFDSLFYVLNKSMSTYLPNSAISRLNRNVRISEGNSVRVDEHFEKVFKASEEIYKATNGAFDPTIGIVVNAWSFGPEGKIMEVDSMKIETLMQSVGMNKVMMNNRYINRTMPTIYLDFNAIAKGYGVDVIAEFLESQNITNYLVEIGGEIRSKGINIEKQSAWKVGIDKPNFEGEQSVLKAITIKDESMATSGTYRKFKTDENGNRYAHIINTETGYPSKTNILSVSVIAEDCMTADAYATAFQAMGIEKVKAFLKNHPELKVFLVFENGSQELEMLPLNGFPDA